MTQRTDRANSTTDRSGFPDGVKVAKVSVSQPSRPPADRSLQHSLRQIYRERIASLREFGSDEGVELRAESVDSFWLFVNANVDYRRGGLVLTDEGNISASWSEHPTDHVALEFLGGQDVGYVIFKGNGDDDVTRVGGVDTMQGIARRLEQIGLDTVLRE